MTTYRGTDGHSEWLVTTHDAEGTKPAVAEVCWRGDEWETFSAPVQLTAVIGS